MDTRKLAELLGSIYELPFERKRPLRLMDNLRRFLNSDIAALTSQRPDTGDAFIYDTRGLSARAIDEYQKYYAGRSVLLRESARYSNVGEIFCDDMIPDYREYTESEAYNDFFRPNGADHLMQTHIESSGRWVTAVVLRRPKSSGSYTNRDRELFQFLIPHFVAAARHARAIEDHRLIDDSLLAALEELSVGVMVLDAQDRVTFNNRRMDSLLRTGKAFRIHDRRVVARRHEDNAQFQRVLADARAAFSGLSHAGRGFMTIRESGEALVVSAIPLTTKIADRLGCQNGNIMVFVSGARDSRSIEQVISRLYGLTPSEVGVAMALYRGAAAREIAEVRETSQNAVRFHIKNLFQKLGVRRQSELVKKIANSPVLLRPRSWYRG